MIDLFKKSCKRSAGGVLSKRHKDNICPLIPPHNRALSHISTNNKKVSKCSLTFYNNIANKVNKYSYLGYKGSVLHKNR